ncbi:putative serine hydrolase [Podospora fimiseda]|uniref:Serine hydrolase n=1 Tax=Podospora fimiseda TaxID=252190 RepID=A0AAN7H2D5_9PEZI|nr:putative serine hydrolase [Podospora fimiseda]
MRILALHGHGTSAQIFQSQTAALRTKLPPSYQFTFLNAPHPAPPAPGIKVIFNSSHHTWYTSPKGSTPSYPSITSIRASHVWLEDYITLNGPFDTIIAFSQGCSLVATYLLYHALESPDAPLPFKACIFICGGLPLGILEDIGIEVSKKAHEINDASSILLRNKATALNNWAELQGKGKGLWDDTKGLLHDPSIIPDDQDVFGLDFTKIPKNLKIKIPTVNIYGGKDPRWPSSVQLARFCEDTKCYDHGGGHDIPRSTEVSLEIAGLIKRLAQKIGE